MPQSLSSHSIFTSFIITLTLLLCAWSSPAVLAQKFRPTPDIYKCSAFVEGQAFYLLGGLTEEKFILDLSVSWNTSDPAYKKLEGGPPKVDRQACAMTNNGEDLFVMSVGAAYIYNVKSNSWKPFPNANFATSTKSESGYYAVTDPETDIIYLPNGGTDFTGRELMLSVDIKTGTVNTSGSNPYAKFQPVWNAYWKSFVVVTKEYGLMTFTPSNVTKSSDGWNVSNIPTPEDSWMWDCGASAYGGSMMIFVTYTSGTLATPSTVYILDVIKQTWKQGPSIPEDPGLGRESSSCAVSGDQFIVWGGVFDATYANTTRVFNIKTNKWVSRYIPPPPPPPRPTRTTTLQPSQSPASILESGNTTSSDKKSVIIVAVIGALLAIILGFVFGYRQRPMQSHDHGSSRSSLDIKDDGGDTFGAVSVGRPYGGGNGARKASDQLEHPHAILEDPASKLDVQKAIQIPLQHPHTVVDMNELAFLTPPQHPHTIGDQELENQ
ncbi:MAG: hypothetical protein J3Q66DRAFT_401694 [Benniella sp.]|nr:MAG: hypothetical protein J3Q66DRAFT_401694 [Benniella sp.]